MEVGGGVVVEEEEWLSRSGQAFDPMLGAAPVASDTVEMDEQTPQNRYRAEMDRVLSDMSRSFTYVQLPA